MGIVVCDIIGNVLMNEPTGETTYQVAASINGMHFFGTEYGTHEAAQADLTQLLKAIPVPMLLWCPECSERHIDRGEFADKSHHTHACQSCGHCWRPAVLPTVGVQFLPGFKDEEEGT